MSPLWQTDPFDKIWFEKVESWITDPGRYHRVCLFIRNDSLFISEINEIHRNISRKYNNLILKNA